MVRKSLVVVLVLVFFAGCKSQPRPTPQEISEAAWDEGAMPPPVTASVPPAAPTGTTPAPSTALWPIDSTAPTITPRSDIPTPDGFQNAPDSFRPILPTGYQYIDPANPEVVTPNYTAAGDTIPRAASVAVTPGPDVPIARLMEMYYQEFNTDLWLMTRVSVRTPQYTGNLYAGSIAIDEKLNVRASYDDRNAQVEVVRVVKEDKRLLVYYLYRYLGPVGSRSLGGRIQYFWFDLSSPMLFNMIQQKRSGIMGFEVTVEEIMQNDLPQYSR